MATAVDDSYSVASGQSVRAGRSDAVIGITSPVQYQMHQRNSGTTGSIAITGTHSGIHSGGIEASFNGGAYQTIVASPTGSTFSGTLTSQSVGQGTLTVRAVNSPGTPATKGTIGLGDVYIVTGDSNHSGRATTSTVQASSTNGLVAVEYANDGVWKPHQESTDAGGVGCWDDPTGALYANTTGAGGSYFGALATLIMNNKAIPVAFIPCAVGSTTLTQWAVVANGTNTGFLYGIALTRALAAAVAHKAMLLCVGTNLDGLSEPDSETAYNAIVNAWKTDTGAKTVIYLAVNASTNNNNAVAAVLGSNGDALAGPDFNGAWAGTHYLTAAEINVAAGRAWTALQTLFYP